MSEYIWITLIGAYIPIILSLNRITQNTRQMEKNTTEMLEKMKRVDSIIEKIREN
jgi:hypothetical protein